MLDSKNGRKGREVDLEAIRFVAWSFSYEMKPLWGNMLHHTSESAGLRWCVSKKVSRDAHVTHPQTTEDGPVSSSL